MLRLFSPSRLLRIYCCDICRKIWENLETEEIAIVQLDNRLNWGRRCPNCKNPCELIREVMT